MVLRGGENIYCAEVERVVYEHPGVFEAAAFGVPDDRLGEELAVVVMRRPGAGLDAAAVREHVARHLARFKVPRYVWIQDEKLPRGATAKIDKRAVRARRLKGDATMGRDRPGHAAIEGWSPPAPTAPRREDRDRSGPNRGRRRRHHATRGGRHRQRRERGPPRRRRSGRGDPPSRRAPPPRGMPRNRRLPDRRGPRHRRIRPSRPPRHPHGGTGLARRRRRRGRTARTLLPGVDATRRRAGGRKHRSFPAISTGVYGFPVPRAARIAVRTVSSELDARASIRRVVLCCFGAESRDAHTRALDEFRASPG